MKQAKGDSWINKITGQNKQVNPNNIEPKQQCKRKREHEQVAALVEPLPVEQSHNRVETAKEGDRLYAGTGLRDSNAKLIKQQ